MAEKKRTVKKNFIDFILEAQSDERLIKGFIKAKSTGKLTEFFEKKGYKVTKSDCDKLMKAKEQYGLTEWPPPPSY